MERRGFPVRKNPYYRLLSYGRAIGYLRRETALSQWVARYTDQGGRYHSRRLGLADTYPHGPDAEVYSFREAVDLAEAWFGTATVTARARSTRDLGRRLELVWTRPRGSSDRYLLGDALAEWLEWKRLSGAPSSHYVDLCRINRNIIPLLGNVPAIDIDRTWLVRFAEDMLARPPRKKETVKQGSLSPEYIRRRKKTINAHISIVRQALLMAWESKRIDDDRPYRSWRLLPNVHQPRLLHLSRPECRLLLEHCADDLRELVLGALYTGCRFAELSGMRTRDVGSDGFGVYVAPGKTRHSRFVFLPDEGMTFFLDLLKRREPGALLFARREGGPWRHSVKATFKTAVLDAGLDPAFGFHGLRHTYASQLVQAGTPLAVVARQLGHKTIHTVANTYGHLAPQIAEAEIQQRFTSLDERLRRRSARKKKELVAWRGEMFGGTVVPYAQINDLSSRERTR